MMGRILLFYFSVDVKIYLLIGSYIIVITSIVVLLNNQNSDNVCTMAIKPKINHVFKSCVVF